MKLTEVHIPSTNTSPEVILMPGGTIKIKGRGLTVNRVDVPEKIMKWIEEYLLDPAESTCVDICFEYLNSYSSTILVTIIKKISTVLLKGKKLIINWHYEDDDDDVYERGEYISSSISIPFNFIKIT
ncbi:MAG: SiaC family regulatory phosphoprotein [Bacteroidales bacterium]|jgi:hypothetical protein|nr:SiaC family regulatory phosphoprotein [Bacteroidales bacterium]